MITVRGVVFSALFAAILVVFSYLSIPLHPVPIVLENMAVMMAGAFLGGRYGFLSMLLVVLLTALGLPLLHDNGGLGVIFGATGGYIWMWPFNALLTGWFVNRVKSRGAMGFLKIFLVIEVFGSLLTYVTGVPWLAHVAHVSFGKAMVLGFYPFILPDAVKALVTTAIVVPLRAIYPASRLSSGGGPGVVLVED